jgi:hypothetical protein
MSPDICVEAVECGLYRGDAVQSERTWGSTGSVHDSQATISGNSLRDRGHLRRIETSVM